MHYSLLNEGAILRTAQRITDYIQRYVELAGAGKREHVLKLFDSIQQFFPQWGIMTCQHMHPDILYISQNCSHILGQSAAYLEENNFLEKYFELVHEADKPDLHSCFVFQHDYLERIVPADHQFYRSVFYYRCRKANGQLVHIQDEKAVLNLDGGNLYYFLLRDLTAEKPFNGVKLELYRHDTVLHKIKEYKPAAENTSLSKRETELVTLIKQGLNTKEIAWYLKISHHTVRNIKSRLFEKYKVNNTVELLNMTA